MKENLKNYLDKKPNAKVCILDNNSVEFLNKLKTKDISTVEIFKQYDVVLIPNWVLIEINDSRFRSDFIEELKDNGVNIYKIQEKEYILRIKDCCYIMKKEKLRCEKWTF